MGNVRHGIASAGGVLGVIFGVSAVAVPDIKTIGAAVCCAAMSLAGYLS